MGLNGRLRHLEQAALALACLFCGGQPRTFVTGLEKPSVDPGPCPGCKQPPVEIRITYGDEHGD